jgi:hypothetical protein
MMLKSGHDLKSNTLQFIEEKDCITLFSAYIKLEELKRINQSKKIKQIIVRWEIRDLCLGVSDLEVYHYCLDNNITLYRNTRIHLKAFWDNCQSVLFGSANVTGRGVGEKGRYNYELNGIHENINFHDVAYFNNIIINSEYVTAALFKRIENLVLETILPTINYPILDTTKNLQDYFLLSNLPMTETVEKLYKGYSIPEGLSMDEVSFVTHDLALYDIPGGLDETGFYKHLKNKFNSHPFIIKLKGLIKVSLTQSLNYGSVVRFIQENTTTVPTPRSWELKQKQIINILYDWICSLDENYYWDVPGSRSQVIYYKTK